MAKRDAYARIEAKTGFRVPELYRRMRTDGALDYPPGARFGDLRRGIYEHQPALTCALDFEWIPLKAIEDWEPPDYWLPQHTFVPFAQSHAGDDYAWYPAWANGDEVPVVFAWRDNNCCDVIAPHLEGFMYRKTLEKLCYESAYDTAYDTRHGTWEELREGMRRELDVLRPYLRARWMADLDELFARKPREWRSQLGRREEKYLSQLDDDELKGRISRELAFPQLDTNFPHMKPPA